MILKRTQYPFVRCGCLQRCGLPARWLLFQSVLDIQWIETATLMCWMTKMDTESGTMSPFPTSLGSARRILMTVYVSEGSEENARHLLVFPIGIDALHLVWWFGQPLIIRHAHLQFELNLSADWYISDILRPVFLPCLGGLPNAIFQQDKARPHVARLPTFLDTWGIWLPPSPIQSPDVVPIENICS